MNIILMSDIEDDEYVTEINSKAGICTIERPMDSTDTNKKFYEMCVKAYRRIESQFDSDGIMFDYSYNKEGEKHPSSSFFGIDDDDDFESVCELDNFVIHLCEIYLTKKINEDSYVY